MGLSLLFCTMGEYNRTISELLGHIWMPKDPTQRRCSTRHRLDPRALGLCVPVSPFLLGPAWVASGSKLIRGYFCGSHRAPGGWDRNSDLQEVWKYKPGCRGSAGHAEQ